MTQLKNVIKDNYNMMLLNDFLREEIKEAGFHKVEVSKTPSGTKITLYVTRPGIVIGRWQHILNVEPHLEERLCGQ